MISKLLFYLKVSRPGLWFATIWLYLLPTSQMDVLHSPTFWLGLIYVGFPLNFLVYGWNDIVDYKTDALNPRKDTFWFGARGSKQQLSKLWKPIAITQLLFFPLLVWIAGWKMILLLIAFAIINGLYNLPEKGLRSRPPLELFCQVGYLLIAPFSIFLNDTDPLSIPTYTYLLLFAVQSHLMGEVMDIQPDRQSGRKTTATEIGMKNTKLLIMSIVVVEIALMFFYFNEHIFGIMLLGGLAWLIIDLYIIFKTKTYNLQQMKLFSLLSNVLAIASMSYVWYSGCLS